MNNEEPTPLDPELAGLLAAERARPARPQVEIDRAYSDTEQAVLGAPHRRGRPGVGRLVGPAVGLALGVAIGYAWGHADRPLLAPPVTTAPIDAPHPAPIAPSAPPQPWTLIAPATPTAPTFSVSPSQSQRPPPLDSLGRERALLETARAALARGDSAAGLDAIARHAREFPQGRLVEEGDALRVRALVAAGRVAEARTAAEAFRGAHPDSVLQPSVDAALRTLP